MPEPITILGLGGSLAARSVSLAALRIAMEGAQDGGARIEIFDIRTMNLPFYRPDSSEVPESARRFVDAVHQANGMIWSSPMYHGTDSGAFKNALDWLNLLKDYEPALLTDKVVGLVSTAGGMFGLQAVNTMEFAVRALRGWAVPMVMPIARAEHAFRETGQPRDPAIGEQLRRLGQEVVRASRQFADHGWCDYSDGHLTPTSEESE